MRPRGFLQSSWNIGDTRWGCSEGGLPARKPKWALQRCGVWGVTTEMCMSAGEIFACSARQEAVCIDAESGEYRWRAPLPEPSNWGVAIGDRSVFVSPYLIDRSSGTLLFDGRRDTQLEFPECVGCSYRLDAGFATPIGKPFGSYLLLDDGGGYETYSAPYSLMWPPVGEGLFVGWDGAGQVLGYDRAKGEVLWRHRLPVARDGRPMGLSALPRIDNHLYLHVNFDTLWCVDVRRGDFVWKRGPDEIEQNETPYQCRAPSTILACDDRLYLCRTIEDDGFLQAHDAADGALLWRVEAPQSRALVIAGDLIFGSANDVPAAWDRYTGEIVWRAAKAFAPLFHSVAADNKVLFTNTFGGMQCYEWKQPYRSPARP